MFYYFYQLKKELEAVREEGNAEHKIDVESEDKPTTESEKDKDTKEDNQGADSEQKQDEEKPSEKTSADEAEEKPEEVATLASSGDTVEHVAVSIEEEAKTENAEGGEGEIKTESTEGGEGEPNKEEAQPVTSETVVTNETETGVDYSKYEIDDELPWAMYRSMDTPNQRSPVEEDDDWPASDEDEDYGKLLKNTLLAFEYICV